jgi:hypothetical protein
MRQVYTSHDPAQLGLFKSLLDEAGLDTSIRNENADDPEGTGAASMLALCVDDDGDYEKALDLIKAHEAKAEQSGEEWKCPACAETNAPNLNECWNCDMARPEVS